jgi:hypothetical protein
MGATRSDLALGAKGQLLLVLIAEIFAEAAFGHAMP